MDIQHFIKSLQLGNINRIQRYVKGQHNDTYKVISSKGIFSVRVYKYKKPSQIAFELAVLNHLKGLKVPRIRKINGSQIKKYKGKPVIVYDYIPGEQLETFTQKQLEEMGSFIGEFHKKCSNFTWKKQRYQFYNLPDKKIEKFTKKIIEEKVKFRELLPRIIKDLKENRLNNQLPKGPIHVDIKPENVLFHKGKLSGVLDFDNAYIGPLVLDLTKSMVWFGTKNKNFNLNDALAVYRGYIKKRPLTKLEQEELYKAIKFAFLSHIFVDYYMRAIEATTQAYFDFIINDLYAAYKMFTLTKEEFDN